MKVLVTGDRGYIGSVLVPIMLNRGYEVTGLDCGFYEENLLENYKNEYQVINKDIRDIDESDLLDIQAIIHLAALSNDPLGEFSPSLTYEINYESTVKIAMLAKSLGVKRFIYSSSQSMYGISDLSKELDEDKSKKNPVTAYAKAKWKAEQEIHSLSSKDFVVTSFRPSTVFGASPRLRCDIVFNNLVACAYTSNKIEILSDGSPWRPVVHIRDVCEAFLAGLEAPSALISGKAFNVGIENGNFTVKDLAIAAQDAVPGSELHITNEHTDPRTYKVSFNRIFEVLGDFYKPSWNLKKGGNELIQFFKRNNFTKEQFKNHNTIRLKQLMRLQEEKKLDRFLKFI